MRITLLYNPDAGEGMSGAALREEIERHGHEILHVVNQDADLAQALDGSPDLIVAAGGDGTVSRAANLVAEVPITLAILPLGTANNIATSLGIEGAVPELIDAWPRARRQWLDLGILHNSQGERRFIESVGIGLVTIGIASATGEPAIENARRAKRVERARRHYLDVLEHMQPRPRVLSLDGERVEGTFLLIEALNMASIGPNLELAPDATPSDGRLSVVLAEEYQRACLADYLRALLAGDHRPLRLPTRLVSEMIVESVHEAHVDDEVRNWSSGAQLSLRVEPAALQVLCGH